MPNTTDDNAAIAHCKLELVAFLLRLALIQAVGKIMCGCNARGAQDAAEY